MEYPNNTAMLAYLREKALQNVVLPRNAEMARELGGAWTGDLASTVMHRLARRGHFELRCFGQLSRQVVFPDGEETQGPEEVIGDIVAKASVIFNVRSADIYGPSRSRKFVQPRFAVISTAREMGYAVQVVGKVLARDHSTICHALNAFGIYLKYQPELRQHHDDLRHASGLQRRLAA